MLRPFTFACALLALGCLSEELDLDNADLADLAAEGSGNLSLEWSIAIGDMHRDCVAAGGDTVRVLAMNETGEYLFDVACSPGLGETGILPADTYEITVQLKDREGGVLDSLPFGLLEVSADRTTPLGAIEFVIGTGK